VVLVCCRWSFGLSSESDIGLEMARKGESDDIMRLLTQLCHDDPTMSDDIWASECDYATVVVIGHLAMAAQIPFCTAYDRVAFLNCALLLVGEVDVMRGITGCGAAVAAGRPTLEIHGNFRMNATSCTLNLGECVIPVCAAL